MERNLVPAFLVLLKRTSACQLLFITLICIAFFHSIAVCQSSEMISPIQRTPNDLIHESTIKELFNENLKCREPQISVLVHNDIEIENINLYCQITDSVVSQINSLLELSVTPEISLFLVDKKFFNLTLKTGPWIQATTINGKMFLRYDPLFSEDSRRIIKHETVHAYIYALAGSNVAAWIEEGLAQIIAGEFTGKYTQRYKNTPPLRTLRKEFTLENQKILAEQYLISAQAVRVLVKEFGFSGIGDYLKKISYGYPHERAFSAIFRMTEADLEKKLPQKDH